MTKLLCRTCIPLFLAGTLGATEKPLILADGGKTSYRIVKAVDASPSEARGAAELQFFLKEITGASFPVVTDADSPTGKLILLGQNKLTARLRPPVLFDKLGTEGFVLRTSGSNLVIADGRQRGTMYGVYTFLEKLGCRWVARDASRIPKTPALRVGPLDETGKPAFEYREIYIGEAFDKDWAARNKTNGQSAALDASTGGKIQYYPFVHSFYALVPPAKYFKEHPEYFSLVDGRRRSEKAQLCLTNPDVLRISTERVLGWMKEHPEATICSVSANDYGGQCECDNCRRIEREEGGAGSGPVVRFVNAIAELVEKQYPDRLVDTLAYSHTETAPTKTRPRQNVRVRMCPIGACNAHPYERCPHDAYIMKNLRAWSSMTSNIYIWHYNANFSHFLLPVPDFDELAADLPMYKRNGVVGMFMQGAYAPGSSDGPLRAYVLSRLLWDTGSDVSKAIQEFHEIYYGKAAAPMRAYFDLLHALVRFPPEGEGQHWWCCRAPSFSDAGLAKAKELYRQALAAADDDAVRRRVQTAEMSIRYLELRRQQQFVLRGTRYEPRGLEWLREQFPLFRDALPKTGIPQWGEDSRLEQYLKNFNDTLKSHGVVTLENDVLRLHLVPALNARVVSITDKRTRRELLNQPASVETNYPDRGGLSSAVYSDYVDGVIPPVTWVVDSSISGREVTLAGTAEDGIRLQRTIRLAEDGPRVATETVLHNDSGKPYTAILQSQFDADAGRMDDAAVEFRGRNQEAVNVRMIEPAAQPVGGETYLDARMPDGEWRVVNRASGLAICNSFPAPQAARCVLAWSAKNQHRVSLSVWSPKRTLAPGESMRLETSYELR